MKFRNIISVLTSIVVVLSCKKDKNSFPIEPVLEYKSFEAYSKYEAFMVLKFTDGDGDIGLKTSDTTGIYDKSSPYY